MPGRPARIPDPALAARLRALQSRLRISQAAVARMLGIEASTYCRSLKSGSFSEKSARAARVALAKRAAVAHAPRSAPAQGMAQAEDLARALHLLQEAVTLLQACMSKVDPSVAPTAERDLR